MAVKDDVKEQWDRQKDKPLKQRAAYFMRYYFIRVVIVAAIAVFVGALVYSRMSVRKPVLTAYFINSENKDENVAADIRKRSAAAAGIRSKKETAVINLSMELTPGGTQSEEDMGTITELAAKMREKDLDAMVCDAWNFHHFTEQMMFKDLRDVLTDAQLKKYSDQIYYVDQKEIDRIQKEMEDPNYDGNTEDEDTAAASETYDGFVRPDPTDMDEPVPVGIILSDSSYFKKNNLYKKAVPVFGFVKNSQHTDEAGSLLKLLTE
ncbi:MAG: hypothetical protein PUG04_03230 [Lachnospiraceae bacterium]|nr:hypothetical protein [Lachnospiraceae bacterium]MDD6551525.1 hypothetical protein [Lachnospiraceae bacterium]